MLDYRARILGEMAANKTLVSANGNYFIAEGIDKSEVKKALIERYGTCMNEAIQEPYYKAKNHNVDTQSIVSSYLNKFAQQVVSDCSMMGIDSSVEGVITRLKVQLADSYFQDLG